MKIALCDDSAYDLELLKKTISENSYIREGQIDLYTDVNDLLKNIQNGEFYDIFFLDIEMPEINGITLVALQKAERGELDDEHQGTKKALKLLEYYILNRAEESLNSLNELNKICL